MPNDIPDWTDSVNVSGGSVNVATGDITVVGGQGGVSVSTDSPPQLLGFVNIPAGFGSVADYFTVPANATGIVVLPQTVQGIVGHNIISVMIAGGYTGYTYAQVNTNGNPPPPVFAAIAGPADNQYQVNISLSGPAAQAANIAAVYALIGTGAQQVFTTPSQPLDVTQAGGLPLLAANIGVVLANAATSPVVAASVGFVITIYGWHLSVAPDTAPTGFGHWTALLQDSSGVGPFARVAATIATAAGALHSEADASLDEGVALPVGRGVQVQGFTGPGANVNVNGVVYYTRGLQL